VNENSVIRRLRRADPAAGRDVVDEPDLRRARVEAILTSSRPDSLAATPPRGGTRARASGGFRYPRTVALAVAALAIPGVALAASAMFGPDDVERGLPAGAQLLVGSDPACHVVEADISYDCTLKTAPTPRQSESALRPQPSWRGAVSLLVDRGGRIDGGCRSQSADGIAWRCYIGQAAAEQRILDPKLLGTPIHDHCDDSTGAASPVPDGAPVPRSALEAAPDSAIILCGARDLIGFSATRVAPGVGPERARRHAARRHR
jgi:hypothetical protein